MTGSRQRLYAQCPESLIISALCQEFVPKSFENCSYDSVAHIRNTRLQCSGWRWDYINRKPRYTGNMPFGTSCINSGTFDGK